MWSLFELLSMVKIDLWNYFFIYFLVQLLIQQLFLASNDAFKNDCASLLGQDILMEIKSGHGHCSISIICGQFARRHCWATCALHSRWICHSVWQPSVDCSLRWTLEAEVNEQLYYCLQKQKRYHLAMLQWCHSRVKQVLLFVEILK